MTNQIERVFCVCNAVHIPSGACWCASSLHDQHDGVALRDGASFCQPAGFPSPAHLVRCVQHLTSPPLPTIQTSTVKRSWPLGVAPCLELNISRRIVLYRIRPSCTVFQRPSSPPRPPATAPGIILISTRADCMRAKPKSGDHTRRCARQDEGPLVAVVQNPDALAGLDISPTTGVSTPSPEAARDGPFPHGRGAVARGSPPRSKANI